MISADDQRLIELAVAAAPPLTSTQAKLVRSVVKPEEWHTSSGPPVNAAPSERLGRAA